MAANVVTGINSINSTFMNLEIGMCVCVWVLISIENGSKLAEIQRLSVYKMATAAVV